MPEIENSAIDTLSYEQARDQLAEVVSTLETGGTSLEQALALWERGEALANRCEEWLRGAEQQLQKVLDAAPEASADKTSRED